MVLCLKFLNRQIQYFVGTCKLILIHKPLSGVILHGVQMLPTKVGTVVKLAQVVGPIKLLGVKATHSVQKRHKNELYEPDYLISMEPDEPVYDSLNFQVKGYDFTILEAYQSQLHRYAEVMGIQVEECWATPAQKLKVQRFQKGGTAVDAEYNLNVYERNVQVSEVPAWSLGTLVRVARALLPEGCTLSVHEHAAAHEELRYVPDNQLIELKQQLDGMGAGRPHTNKKKKL